MISNLFITFLLCILVLSRFAFANEGLGNPQGLTHLTCSAEERRIYLASALHQPRLRVEGIDIRRRDFGDPSGVFYSFSLHSRAEGITRRVHVLLPREYSALREYPVMYFNDGQNVFHLQENQTRSWDLEEALSQVYQESPDHKRYIVVAIEHSEGRQYEYAHFDFNEDNANPANLHISKYAQFLADELKPFIDRNFMTLAGRQHTTVAGSSLGGLTAFYTGLVHRESFGTVLGLSSSFWVGAGENLRESAMSILHLPEIQSALRAQLRPRLFLGWGMQEARRITHFGAEMVNILQQDYHYTVDQNLIISRDAIGYHNEQTWGGRMKFILRQKWFL